LVGELAGRGKVILFSSHELETVERVSSRVVILHRGKVAADDSIEHLRVLRSAATLEDVSRSSPWSRTARLFPARSPI
jgi:ABC-2 type transport system ATP-binding protein